jgi:gliding motility-associated lipoprotein GldH
VPHGGIERSGILRVNGGSEQTTVNFAISKLTMSRQINKRYNKRPTMVGRFIIQCSLLIMMLASCRHAPQYQDHYNIPGSAWDAGYKPVFRFTITDTAAAYQLFLLIRHTDAYPFSNIWMNMESRAPGDSVWGKTRVEIPLAAPSGQWLGRGLGELWEQRVPITTPARPAFFARKGEYSVRLIHDMRRNPLPEVLTIGLSLEKLPPFRKQ